MTQTTVRIGVDARGALSKTPRGHIKTFLNTYRELALLEPSWEFIFYLYPQPERSEESLSLPGNIRCSFLDAKGSRFFDYAKLWEHVSLPLALYRDKVSCFHSTCGPLPAYCPCPSVSTIHDLMPLIYTPLEIREQERVRLSKIVRRATKILTISQYSKRAILDAFGREHESKISLVRWDGSEFCKKPRDIEEEARVREKYKLHDEYLLFFGHENHPRKNLIRLLEALGTLKRESGMVVDLCVTGVTKVDARETVLAHAASLGIEDRIRMVGYVEEAEIPSLLRQASALVYVSLYEGFGLPPLDAMWCECPVIASSSTSIPEVVCDAARYVDPEDTKDIASAISSVLEDKDLRDSLIEKGKIRRVDFSWRKAAEDTRDVFHSILS